MSGKTTTQNVVQQIAQRHYFIKTHQATKSELLFLGKKLDDYYATVMQDVMNENNQDIIRNLIEIYQQYSSYFVAICQIFLSKWNLSECMLYQNTVAQIYQTANSFTNFVANFYAQKDVLDHVYKVLDLPQESGV